MNSSSVRGSATLTEMATGGNSVPRTSLRASDADRERVAELLRHHYGAGRLSDEDLAERVDAAYGVRTMGELEALTDDLPSAPQPDQHPPRDALETSVRTHLTVFI